MTRDGGADDASRREVKAEEQCGQKKGNCAGLTHKTDVALNVCQSCEHLYPSSGGVILSPSSLVLTPPHTPHASPPVGPRPPSTHAAPALHTPLSLWTTRRYGGLCECVDEGGQCSCGASSWPPPRPHLPSCWPRVKVALLVVAAILPWAFLVIYLVLAYTL